MSHKCSPQIVMFGKTAENGGIQKSYDAIYECNQIYCIYRKLITMIDRNSREKK